MRRGGKGRRTCLVFLCPVESLQPRGGKKKGNWKGFGFAPEKSAQSKKRGCLLLARTRPRTFNRKRIILPSRVQLKKRKKPKDSGASWSARKKKGQSFHTKPKKERGGGKPVEAVPLPCKKEKKLSAHPGAGKGGGGGDERPPRLMRREEKEKGGLYIRAAGPAEKRRKTCPAAGHRKSRVPRPNPKKEDQGITRRKSSRSKRKGNTCTSVAALHHYREPQGNRGP